MMDNVVKLFQQRQHLVCVFFLLLLIVDIYIYIYIYSPFWKTQIAHMQNILDEHKTVLVQLFYLYGLFHLNVF